MIGSASNINHYLNLFGVQKGLTPEKTAASIQAKMPGAGADMLTLSPTAGMLQQFLSMDFQGPASDRGELDLTGIAQLKQRGEMLSNVLQLKLKNFESNLVSSMQSAGFDPSQSVALKDGGEGLSLLDGNSADKESLQQMLGKNDSLRNQFQEIGRLADVLESLKQIGSFSALPGSGIAGLGSAAQYAQQSQQVRQDDKRPEAEFVLRVMEGNASYSFE